MGNSTPEGPRKTSQSKGLPSSCERNPEKYSVNIAKTERYKKSAVPFLQRLLNDDYAKKKKDLKCLLQVNIDVFNNVPIT